MRRIIILVIFALFPLHAISATCSELAFSFSKDSNILKRDELAELRKCVSDQLRIATFNHIQPPPVAKAAMAMPEIVAAPSTASKLPAPVLVTPIR